MPPPAQDRIPHAIDLKVGLGAVEQQEGASCPVQFADRPRSDSARNFAQHLLHSRGLATIPGGVTPAALGHGQRRLDSHAPAGDVDVVRAPICHMASVVISQPSELLEAAQRLIGPQGARPGHIS